MDLNQQAKRIMNLMESDYREGGEGFFQDFCVGRYSKLHIAGLWDGVFLWANDIKHMTRLSFPIDSFQENKYLFLNICHFGRCEVELSPGTFLYMTPGILNVSISTPKSDYYYPGGMYKGIELCIDIRKMREKIPEPLSSYGFDGAVLESFIDRGNVLATMKNEILKEEESLFHMLGQSTAPVCDLRFALLSLLYHLVHKGAEEIGHQMLVTKGQRRIVTEAEQILTEDLRSRHTVEELATLFGISASALKKYFTAVYGRPISQYMREKRMEKAMELLESTNESIGNVALSCGYEHQGKFGTAFRDVTGTSPLEYRRLNRKVAED